MYITKDPIVITLSVQVRPQSRPDFTLWQAGFNRSIASSLGFISLEFLSKPDDHWMIVQRFDSSENALAWKSSPGCVHLMQSLAPLLSQKGIKETTETQASFQQGVTEVIIAEVLPENEPAFTKFCADIHQVEALFEGFRGVYIQSPKTSGGKHWITLLQFDTAEHLDRWLSSKERQEVLAQGLPLITSIETNRIVSPFAGWFSSIAKSEQIPATWQQTMLVLLVLFPIVMLEIRYLSPFTANLNLSMSTFIGNTLSVMLISYPMMPLAIQAFDFWLFPKSEKKQRALFTGTALVLGLYLLEIFIFWSF